MDEPVNISTPPEQPHFDDDRTVYSAQPVVPLDTIDATVKKRRRLFVIGAFVLAMVLGAASALVASYVKLRNAPVVASEVTEEEPPVDPEPVAIAEPVPTESPVTEQDIEAAEIFVAPAKKPERRLTRKRNADVVRDRDEREPTEEEELNQVRDAVLYEEWQERRARRVRRERRRAERYNHRDLSNLDEIFEGRRRRRP